MRFITSRFVIFIYSSEAYNTLFSLHIRNPISDSKCSEIMAELIGQIEDTESLDSVLSMVLEACTPLQKEAEANSGSPTILNLELLSIMVGKPFSAKDANNIEIFVNTNHFLAALKFIAEKHLLVRYSIVIIERLL